MMFRKLRFLALLPCTFSICANAAGMTRSLAPDGESDMTARVLAAVDEVKSAGGGTVQLASGVYHFRSPRSAAHRRRTQARRSPAQSPDRER